MMLDCLDQHTELYGFPRETRLIAYFIERLEVYGDLDDDQNFRRLWQEFGNTSLVKSVNKGRAAPLPDNWRVWPRNIASVIDGVFSYFATMNGPGVRWVEKTPMNVLHIAKIAEVFPEAKFIHMIRDGRDCAASFHRRWHYNPQWTLFRWKKAVHNGRSQGRKLPDRYIEIRYEDLTTSPEKWMKKVCEFINVPFDPIVLQPRQRHLERSNTRDENEPPQIVPNSKKWREYFNDKQLLKLDKIAGKPLADLGYETSYPASDIDPPSWRIKFWLINNYIRRGFSEFTLQLQRKKGRNWRFFFGRLKNALRQSKTNRY